jgi:tetratricopeptide (TPR) repeat protein
VRFGSNPGFDRAVFDWPEDVDYRIEQNGRTATMTFGAPVALNQAAIAAGLQASTSSVRTARTADRATIEMTLNENVGLRHFRAGPRVVLDLVRDGSIPTDRPTTQLVQLPTPAQAQATQAQAAQAQAAQAQAAQAQAQGAQARQPASAAQAPAATQAARRSGTPDFEVLAQQAQALGLNQSAAPAASGRSAAANLVALRGRIPVEVTREENFDALRFGFDEPIGLAVFGRGQNLWIAFDKPVNLDLAALQSGPQMRDMLGEVDIVESQGTVLRMSPRNGAFALVRRDGAAWVVELGRLPRRPEKPLQIVIRNPDTPADARVSIEMEGAQTVLRLRDPEIGDELAIVPTAVAGNGLAETRRYPQFQILASMQGAVVRPDDDTVAVRPLGTAVEISSSRALFVTAPTAIGTPGAPPLRQGALLDLAAWQRGGPAKFNEDQSALERAVAASRPGDARNQARLDYARFMFSHGLFAETNAMLRLIGEERPQLLDGPQNRAMRGVAELYSGNLDEAARWLNHSSLDQEGEAAMWRGALAMAQNDPQAALLQFDRATDVSGRFPPLFANRLGLAIAEARIEGKELDVAQRRIEQVLAASPSRGDQARADYLRGRIALERGDERAALAAWRTLSLGTVTRARVQAELARIELQSGKGEISPQETVAALDRMRFAWRGDELEFEIHRRLGNAQLAAGDFRQGVRTLRETAERFPMARDRAELENDVRAEFRKLFLDGGADGMSPVTAIGLFEDYRDLVPMGPAGDEMVRKLVERLVAVDLLDRAGGLLEHQVRNRLQGPPRAEAGARLAAIRLLDRKPQLALDALNASEGVGEPAAVRRERGRLAARALADLGRASEALARLDGDTGSDADLLRAEIALRTRAWPAAAQALERLVGAPPTANQPFEDNRARQTLHLAVSLALAGDDAGTARLRERFGPAMSRSPYAEVFRVLTADKAGATPDIASIAARVSSLAPFESFMAGYRQRLAGPAKPATG